MKKKIISLIGCLTLSACYMLGCTQKNPNGAELINGKNYTAAAVRTAETFHSVSFENLGGSNVMPLGVWWGPYGSTSGDTINGMTQPNYLTDEIFQALKDSGVNFIAASADQYPDASDSITKVLDLCEKYDIGYFVQDRRVKGAETAADVISLVENYITHPAALGLHLADEPFTGDIEPLGPAYKAFSETEYAANKQVYVNLLPSYAGTNRLGGSYYSYLTRFVETTNTKFLSYDNYPFRSQDQGTTYSMPASYFSDLSIVRKVANEHDIPFWVFVQAGGQWEEQRGKPSEPLFPNEGETMWNINTCLAYGAKSIQYFTFLQPTYFADAGGNERDYQRNSMLGVMGNKTQWYYYIQKANVQISAIDHILMNSAHMGVMATGYWKDRIDGGDKPIGGGDRAWRELTSFTSSDEETGVMIGCFDYNFERNNSRSAYYVVNTDSKNKQTVTLNFSKKYGYDVIQRGVSVGVTGKSVTLTLECGEGVMLALR